MSPRGKPRTPAEVVQPLRIPSILERLSDSAPEYLRSKATTKKADAAMMRKAVEEILGDEESSCVDWSSVERLQEMYGKDTKSPQLRYCVDEPVVLPNGVKVHILGVVHSSEASALNVERALEELDVKCIALESDVARTEARRKFQLPLMRRFEGKWADLTDLKDLGGQGASVEELARARLVSLAGSSAEVAQFLAACGSVHGMPELTTIYESDKRGLPLHSVDMLETMKLIQNRELEQAKDTTRRIGDLPESLLRMVSDEKTVFETYLNLLYGEDAVQKCGADKLDPMVAYRLAELEHRSPPHADLLLSELHRLFRPKYYLSHIFLRDVFMSYKILDISQHLQEGDVVLAVVGGVHSQGMRAFLSQESPPCDIHALACCFVDAEVLRRVWLDVFEIDLSAAASRGDLFQKSLSSPPAEEVQQLREEFVKRIFVQKRVQIWDEATHGWRTTEIAEDSPEGGNDHNGDDGGADQPSGRGPDYGALLLEGKLNPYPLEIEADSTHTESKTVSSVCEGKDTPPSKRQKVCGGGK
ncbi:hypothetical protein FOL47_001963 [Perkinsus chesapeaki]|uniref:TraB domain-containing protein n=1 Tax=Perkinsus chesapeaki TaxID=330153 RepID=A0A7J6N199_PERCH|nr:hypothetical protein FOL47_001963 [Perkinsus chesapeaki]